MAQTYIECDGDSQRTLTVDMTSGVTSYKQYTMADGTIVTEQYIPMTFTCSPAPISPEGLKIYFLYDHANVSGTAEPTEWWGGLNYVTMPQGQTSLIVDLPLEKHFCYTDGVDDGTLQQESGLQ